MRWVGLSSVGGDYQIVSNPTTFIHWTDFLSQVEATLPVYINLAVAECPAPADGGQIGLLNYKYIMSVGVEDILKY